MSDYGLPEEYQRILREREEIHRIGEAYQRERKTKETKQSLKKAGVIAGAGAAILIALGAYHLDTERRISETKRIDSVVNEKFNEEYAPLLINGPYADPYASYLSEIKTAYMIGRVDKPPQYASVDEVVIAAERGREIRQKIK